MARTDRWLLMWLCVAGATALTTPLGAQTIPDSKAAPARQTEVTAPDPLPGLPHPPEQPANLYTPMLAPPYANTDPMPPKYFTVDPLLDPPGWQPGWYTSLQATWSQPVVVSDIYNNIQVGFRPNADLVHVPVHNLNQTVIPRIEVGYRLPSGFGGFALAYRGLSTSGNSTVLIDELASVHSRLDFNIFDLDYVSQEWALGPNCRMDWRTGLRFVTLYIDSQDSQPFDATVAAGTGILSQRVTNHQVEAGVHCGLELAGDLHCAGLEAVANCDIAGTFGRVSQGFYETAIDVNGLPNSAGQLRSSSNPMANAIARLGLAWQPPDWTMLRFFLGYEFDYWWEVGRLGAISVEHLLGSQAQIWDQGLVVRAQICW
jgi:hypothetical protein